YMPLSSSSPPIPPHAASSPTSSCTTTTEADPIYQNIEECRFLYDSPPLAEAEYRTIDKSPSSAGSVGGRPTMGGVGCMQQPIDTPPGYRRIDSATKGSPVFSLPPPPPLDDHEMPSTSKGIEQNAYETLSKTASPISYYDDLSDYGEHHLVSAPLPRRSDFRPQSFPPSELRRIGSQKGAGILSSKSSSPCSSSCLCCLILSTVLIFGLSYIIYFFFSDIESWTKRNVINKL
ncbi:hypothetical protein PFISCL1PPCAC_9773, partial [Pristionchus fissidentatus]